MLINGSFARGKTFRYKCTDPTGERTLIVPPSSLPHVGDPTPIVLDIEARTGTRLKDGKDPLRFNRVWHDFKKGVDAAAGISFAAYCKRRHSDWIDVAPTELSGASTGVPPASSPPDTRDGPERTLHRDEKDILGVLAEMNQTVVQVDLEAAMHDSGCRRSRSTIGRRLKLLRARGLVHRPDGDRGGDAITKLGRQALEPASAEQ